MTIQRQQHAWNFYIAAGSAFVAITFAAYYVIWQGRQVQQRRRIKYAKREICCQFKLIEEECSIVERDIRRFCKTAEQPDKNEKQTRFKLAQCNETLLRLLERLDTIKLKAAIEESEPVAAILDEKTLQTLRHRKKRLIRVIESHFQKLDACLTSIGATALNNKPGLEDEQ